MGERRPIQLVRWLATAHEDGTEMVAINPLRKAHLDGTAQRVVYLNEPFAAFAELLSGEIIKKAHNEDVENETRNSDDYRQLGVSETSDEEQMIAQSTCRVLGLGTARL